MKMKSMHIFSTEKMDNELLESLTGTIECDIDCYIF